MYLDAWTSLAMCVRTEHLHLPHSWQLPRGHRGICSSPGWVDFHLYTWEYSFHGLVGSILLDLLSAASLVYLLRQVARAVGLCLAVSSTSGMEMLLYFMESFFSMHLCWSPDCCLTSVSVALILDYSSVLHRDSIFVVPHQSLAVIEDSVSEHFPIWN